MPSSPARDAAKTPSPLPAAPDRAERCEWCGLDFDGAEVRLEGRARCGRCGAATTDPVPSEDDLERAYADWYRPSGGRFVGPGDAVLRRSRGRLARRLDRIAPPGPILDVGAGDGALLDALKARGRDATGLERTATRPDVRAIDLADVEGRWAAVVFWHALEHLRDAGRAVDRAAAILAPDGLLVIAMPNASSLQATVFGDRWFALDLPRHIVHVPAPAVVARLRDLDLRVERTSHLRGGHAVFGWLYGLVGSLPGRLDLYDAIRRPEARRRPLSRGRRWTALAAAALLLPVAAACAVVEAALGRGGSTYIEARRV